MVLALTILGLAGGLVTGALGTALRSWQGGFVRGREELVARVVLERMAGQLRSAVPSPAKRGTDDAIAFEAKADALRFVTLLSASGGAPAQVGYSLVDEEGRRALVYREFAWPDKDFFKEGNRPRREERLPEIGGLTVRVTKRQDAEAAAPNVTTGESWSPTDGVLPASVTVEIRTAPESGEPATYALTVPIATVAPP
jgi:hypothetical protein